MSMENLKEAIELLSTCGKKEARFSGEKSESLVAKAEEALGLTFPPTYRLFLKKFGCGGVHGFEVYGLIDDNFYGEVVRLSLSERIEYDMPHSFIIIASLGYGPSYVLDASRKNKDGEYPVLVWSVGQDPKHAEKVNEDFGDFLLEQLTDSLSYEP